MKLVQCPICFCKDVAGSDGKLTYCNFCKNEIKGWVKPSVEITEITGTTVIPKEASLYKDDDTIIKVYGKGLADKFASEQLKNKQRLVSFPGYSIAAPNIFATIYFDATIAYYDITFWCCGDVDSMTYRISAKDVFVEQLNSKSTVDFLQHVFEKVHGKEDHKWKHQIICSKIPHCCLRQRESLILKNTISAEWRKTLKGLSPLDSAEYVKLRKALEEANKKAKQELLVDHYEQVECEDIDFDQFDSVSMWELEMDDNVVAVSVYRNDKHCRVQFDTYGCYISAEKWDSRTEKQKEAILRDLFRKMKCQ